MARLLQTHKELHPARIAQFFGVSEDYVRQVWAHIELKDMAPIDEALGVFYGAESSSKDKVRAA